METTIERDSLLTLLEESKAHSISSTNARDTLQSQLLEAEMEINTLSTSLHVAEEKVRQAREELSKATVIPYEIQKSLQAFRDDYPDPTKVAFVMMKFGKTGAHENIILGIQKALSPFGITALRADSKWYHEDLWSNVRSYSHGCGFGIAVYERIEDEKVSPNVTHEIGYMWGIGKKVCLLKDKTIKQLPIDYVGKLYLEFDPLNPEETIAAPLAKWLRNWRFV